MSKEIKSPVFNFLGFNIQQIHFNRIGNEKVEEIKISIKSAKYDEEKNIYSIVLNLSIDFTTSKNSMIEILGGFKIIDEEILKNKNAINSIFSASIYPYLRTVLQNITGDDRPSIVLPTLDLRYVDLKKAISLKPNTEKK